MKTVSAGAGVWACAARAAAHARATARIKEIRGFMIVSLLLERRGFVAEIILYAGVIASDSEAIQSREKALDRFLVALLAMTGRYLHFASPGHCRHARS